MTAASAREARELLGDIAWLARRRDEAAEHYRLAAERAGWAAERRVLLLKRWALAQPARAQELLRRYLVAPERATTDRSRDVHLAHALQGELSRSGLGLYLAAKQLQHAGHCAEVLELLPAAFARGLPSADFELEALEVLGTCRYRAGQPFAAAGAFARLCARLDAPVAVRSRAADWLDRVRWRTTGRVTPPAPWSAARCTP